MSDTPAKPRRHLVIVLQVLLALITLGLIILIMVPAWLMPKQ